MSTEPTKYLLISQTVMRDAYATFVTDHIHLVHASMQAKLGYTPFPAPDWQSFADIVATKVADKPKSTTDKEKAKADKEKAKADKEKAKADKQSAKADKSDKVARTYGAGSRRPGTITMPGKIALASVIVAMTNEAVKAAPLITTSDSSSIKNAILDVEMPHRISPLIFDVCDKHEDAVIRKTFPRVHGNLQNKLEGILDKFITDTNIRNVVVTAFIKFLKIFTIALASDLWFDNGAKSDKPEEAEGKGTSITDKHIKKYLMINSNLLLNEADELNGDYFTSMTDFYIHIVKTDAEKKDNNKKNTSEKNSLKADTLKQAALDACSLEATPAPVAVAAAPAVTAPAAVAASAAPAVVAAPVARRRRGPVE